MFWIELLIESEIVPESKLMNLYKDIDEIVAMTVSSIKTLKVNNPKSKITRGPAPPCARGIARIPCGGFQGK